jgi:taurine transport system ATP-binding protein
MSPSETTRTVGTTDPSPAVDTRHAGSIRLDRVTHQYGRGRETVTAVGPVDLPVPAGEFLVPVGPPAAARAHSCD